MALRKSDTPQRKRRPVEDGEYIDPDLPQERIKEEPAYADEMERSIVENKVTDMRTRPFKAVSPETKVIAAMRMMAKLGISCVLVVEKGKLIGVASERDVLMKVAEDFKKWAERPVREVMTREPLYVHNTDSPAKALNLMAVGGFRHVPIVDVDEKVVGIIGPGRILAYLESYLQK